VITRLLLPTGKVLLTSVKSKIKSAMAKGAKEITKKETDKILKMDKGKGLSIVGKFKQKDSVTMKVPMASKEKMRQIRKNISESVRDFMSKNITKKSKGGLMDYYKDIL
tara:strand:+ start:254 stop:580 length:327 start_codon:yes stop_codon:yes gene_type:complete